MVLSMSASDFNKSEEKQKYFYDEVGKKLSTIKNYKKRARSFIILALCFLALLIFIANLPSFTYQLILNNILLYMTMGFLLIGLFFKQKVDSGRSAPTENGYIFYRLKNIEKCLSIGNSEKAEKEAKSLIFYVNDIKEDYPNKPFSDKIFKNLSKFEETLRENLYPSLKHSNDEIAKNTEIYLNKVLKLSMEGNLDAICDMDTTGLDHERKSLDELYEPTRLKRIYEDLKDLLLNPKVIYLVTFLIITFIILLFDFFIRSGCNWELVKDDLLTVLFISAVITGGLFTASKKTERR